MIKIEPKISVITVCYNAEDKIEKTIQSVLAQNYPKTEYIIIDGASNDKTVEKIKKYEGKLTWISEPDRGVYDAMNKAINIATGDWLYFLGAGDILFNVLQQIAPKLVTPDCIYYGDVYRHDIQKRYDGRFPAFKLAVNNICHQAVFYPRAVFKKYKYDLRYPAMADHYLNMLCYGDPDFNFKYLPIVIAEYEGDGFSAQSPDKTFFEDKLKLVKNNFSSSVYWYAALRNKLAKLLKS